MVVMKIKISDLTKRQLQYVRDEANFSADQRLVFEELNKDLYYDYAIMQNLGLARNRYYSIKRTVLKKVETIINSEEYKSTML